MTSDQRELSRKGEAPRDLLVAADAFRDTLIPKADQMHSGYYPLWHGWALHDAFVAGARWAQPPPAPHEREAIIEVAAQEKNTRGENDAGPCARSALGGIQSSRSADQETVVTAGRDPLPSPADKPEQATPRTDAVAMTPQVHGVPSPGSEWVDAHFARQLERELADKVAHCAELIEESRQLRLSVPSATGAQDAKDAARTAMPTAHALPPGLERLYKATVPFVRLLKGTSGRIPVERLSHADWHELCKAFDECSPPGTRSKSAPERKA